MPDYGHNLLFGTFLPPAADNAAGTLRLAMLADDLGLELASVQDHPYQGRFLDAWTLLSVIAARTTRLRVLPNVANLPLRPPAVLARAAASLDILSGGRVELGLGAGAFADGVAGMGGPRRTAGESIDALEEAITVLRALWAPGRGVTVDGRFYQLAGAHPGPTAPHDIGIWVGSYKPRMLRLTGRLADGWLPSAPYLPPEQLADANAIIDRAAVDAGRDPGAVRRLYNIGGSFAGTGREFLQGPPAVWVEQLAELAVTEGISGFILMTEADGADDLRRFAEEVAPAVRELVAAERTRGAHRPLSTGTADSGFPPGTAGGAGTVTGTPTRSGAPTGTGVATGADASPARRSDPGALGVTPTPDDGRRLSATRLWDESTRPVAPAPDPAISYTDEGRANGQHLVDVHNHLREELAQLRDVVEQVAAGALAVGEARSLLNTMAMRQNNWTLGAFCESYCRVLTTHHTLEDEQMFPGLRRADPGLAPVLDRLEQEHHVIAEVLERVDAALVAMLTEPDGLNRVREAVDLLTDTLLSHLSYEEHQLVEPLSRA